MPRPAVTAIAPILHQYPLRLFAYDFPGLLLAAGSIERQIEMDALRRLMEHLEAAGGQMSGNLARFGGLAVRVDLSSDAMERSTNFTLFALDPVPRHFNIEAKLNEFGSTRRVHITGPVKLRSAAVEALPDLVRIFEAAYRALEESFVTQYLKWRFSLLDEIYSIANAHLRIAGRESLVGRYWFSITDLKRNRFRYQFDRQAIERGIAWFKEHPDTRICGFFGITSLILEEPDDGVFAASEFNTKPTRVDDQTVVLQLSRLPHIGSRLEFAVAERDIYGEGEMACIEIVTDDHVSLQLNCPVSEYQEYQFALDKAAKDIEQRFTEHRRRHKRDLRQMDSSLSRLRQDSHGWLTDVGTDLLAKIVAEMAGPH